ncbi:hypothetical protein Chor_008850 [Crotalus horridus]
MPENLGEPGSRFCYLTDNHTSVVGMRMITTAKNVVFVPVKPKDMLSGANIVKEKDNNCSTPHLFCYPAQSNFSGVKYPLAWIEEIQCGKLCPSQIHGKWFEDGTVSFLDIIAVKHGFDVLEKITGRIVLLSRNIVHSMQPNLANQCLLTANFNLKSSSEILEHTSF